MMRFLAIGLACVLCMGASVGPAAPSAAAPVPPPTALQALSKAVLQEKAASQQRLLEEFAAHYAGQVPGVLAHLVLGYHAYQEKKYAAAKKHFEAARRAVHPALRDYGEYYQALSEVAEGNPGAVVKLLEGFEARYPASPLAPQAVLQLATAFGELQRPVEAIARLESAVVPLPQPDATFLLADAHRKNNQTAQALEGYRKVYYLYPTSVQAQEAEKQLDALRRKLGKAYPAAPIEMRQARAAKLFQASQWRDAQSEYQRVASAATGALRDHARVRVGVCQYQSGAAAAALSTLRKLQVSDAEADAERLYTLAAAHRRLARQVDMEKQIELLAKKYPQSPWHEKALVLAGNYFLLEKEYKRAGDYFRLSYARFPQGESAAPGHWKVAWRAYRERRWADAQRMLEEHIQKFPASPQLSAALYWLGRLVERESPAASARYYRKILEAFPNYYYGLLARQRLAALPADQPQAVPAGTVSLDHIRRRVAGSTQNGTPAADGQPYRERVKLLESAWLMDLAMEELRALLAKDAAALWAGNEMARLEKERGRYHLSLRYAKRYVPSYFAQEMAAFPRAVWELLFPLPWWEQIQKQAAAAQLDPYLVAGLIRQESEFDPQARSRSNARGLMQLLPSTARYMARRVPDPRARRYQLALLYTPDVNLVYGAFYLKQVLDRFNGSLEYALAGYNAGERRVEEWLREGPFEEPAEFVESIPLTETREYVQAVLRNAALYRALYSDGN